MISFYLHTQLYIYPYSAGGGISRRHPFNAVLSDLMYMIVGVESRNGNSPAHRIVASSD